MIQEKELTPLEISLIGNLKLACWWVDTQVTPDENSIGQVKAWRKLISDATGEQ